MRVMAGLCAPHLYPMIRKGRRQVHRDWLIALDIAIIDYNIREMDSVENELAKILADAEAAALNVLAEAAALGNYAAIDRARAIAEKLRAIREGVDRKSGVEESSASPSRRANTKQKKRATTRKKSNYPKYEFKSGSLFKLGWSKKKNHEYVHRVPIAVVNLVSHVLQGFAGTTDPVSSEQIIASNVLNGSVPSYQIYVVLAFLKDRGIINAVGREGFQLPFNVESQTDELLHKEADRI